MTEAQYQDPSSPINEIDDDVFVFPASYAQQRLWFLDQFEPNSPFYNIANAVRFQGHLDLAALEGGLNTIILRHETLRTTFATVEGKPVQVIAQHGSLALRVRDLSRFPEKDRQPEALRLAREEAQTPFDLRVGPLLRASVIRLAEADHILLLTMHHIISDGWSMGILVRELTALYAAYTSLAGNRGDQPSPTVADDSILLGLPIQYADYAQWQQEWLQGAVLEEHIDYWRERLGRDVPVLELYTDRPRPVVQTYRGATHSIKIEQPVVNKLKGLSFKENATLFMTMLAAFQTLLFRYSSQEDICVGTPIANRNREEVEGLIGFFVNTLVIRTDLSGDPTFHQLLQRVRETTLGAFAHQDLPFEMLVERLQPERDMSRSTFFQVMFIMQNAPAGAVELPGMRLSMLETEIGTATFDITLSVSELQDGMDASVEYNTDLFDASTIARMLQNFATLLESIAADPSQPITALNLLTPQEKSQMLFDWANTHRDYLLASQSIQSLFETQQERSPQAVAVAYPASENQPAEHLTYYELNQRANQLAHYLISQGIGPNQLVAVCVEKSLEMVVGLLGILKAGAAYLPLDPSYPQDRLDFMLNDSGARLLLTQSHAMHPPLAHIPPTASIKPVARFYLDTEWHKLASQPQTNPGRATQPDDLAYTIYTSGSTGTPKGVQICQHSLVNAYLAWEETYRLREHGAQGLQPAIHLQMANFAFDVFTGDLVRALCSGGKLVLCPRETLLDPAQLYALILHEEITHAEFVPAVLRGLMQYMEETNQNLAQMRLLACGSDIWHVREYLRIKRLCRSQTRVINSYGLTEATIDSSFYEGSQFNLPPDRFVPIGRPFPNSQMYILDKRLQPQPIGVPGELFVGGAGLALGYLNQPELTAEKFIPHPFNPGKRLYRTGDLARYLPDGNIEYLGRKDFQIKIRGCRIETGEIEAALKSHPGVQDAAVTALPAQPAADAAQEALQTPRLVAYLVARQMVDRAPYRSTCQAIALDEFGHACNAQQTHVEIVDLSPSGVQLLNVPGVWRRGQQIQINLDLPQLTNPGSEAGAPQIHTGNHHISLKGRITWQAGGKAGLHFEIEHSQQLTLERVLRVTEKKLVGIHALNDLRTTDLRLPVHQICWIEPAQTQAEFPVQEHSNRQTTTLENLSLGGARLNMLCDATSAVAQDDRSFSPVEWQVGQAVCVGLSYQNWPGELKLQGQVRWRHSHYTGIAFDSNPQEQMRLEQFLQTVINARRFSLGQLRSYLKARLADYMLPSAFVLLDALPLTPNGKIDRKALPEPDWSQADWIDEYIAPRTPTEIKLAEIWGQVLGRQSSHRIGIRDNFFNLGGHSLLATQLVSRIRQAFEIDLPLRHIFEYPTLEELAERVEILLRGGYSLQAGAITPIPRQSELPLSFAQQRMWFLDQFEPGSPFYNIPEAVRLTGNLDLNALQLSLKTVVQRHEILRTNFDTRDGKPVLQIHPELNIPLHVEDLSHLPPAEREARAQQIAQQEAQTPFDLSCGPLLRARLVRLEKEVHIVLLTMHHIIGDDWSTRVLISEISVIYSAITQGQANPLPDLPIQYVDFAGWQRNWLQGKVLEEQLDYWKQQLANCPPLLELPTDRPRPAVQSFDGSYLTFSLSPHLSKSLRLLCQQEGVTQFMLLLAGFQALLHRYSGQDDICVGTPIANRNRADIEPLIGFFVNTLVLHTTFQDRMTFRELMQQVRECSLGAYAHQDVPFELVVDALQPERNLSQSPLFQVMFVIQNAPGEAQQIPGLNIQPIEAHSGTAKFDLTLFMLEEYERLSGAIEYCTDLFDTATIERMLKHFQNLLESAAADPDQFVENLPILDAAEERQLLYEWNDTTTPQPFDDNLQFVQQIFERQVQRTPEAIAATQVLEIGGASRSFSYRELNSCANQLAHYLRQLGAGPDTLICVCMERSLEMLAALLGILKAGSAYVPLDPSYPPDRLAYMLEHTAQWGDHVVSVNPNRLQDFSKSNILITQRSCLPLFDSLSGSRTRISHIICLDDAWKNPANEMGSTSIIENTRTLANQSELEIHCQPDINPTYLTAPDHLAYVIFTSGSTGRPKGVMITHGGLTNYLNWCMYAYPLDQGIGSPVHSSISFDLTVTSLFSPLLVGRQAVLLPESLGPEALGELLLHVNEPGGVKPAGPWHPQRFSLIKITPAHLKLLGEMIPAEQAPGLTHAFVIGGENLLPEHIDFWQKHAPGTRLFNEYGPTETVVGCCVYELPQSTNKTTPCQITANGALPIGRPIINTCLYVLDKHQQPTPLGVRGELYIGGAGIARGYINRPDLTSERFLPNPFTPADANSDRIYRTGDLAYYLPNGNLVCLGRVDFQVKIRGFRVELGEIETLLSQHALVHESAAWVWEQNGQKRLVAYIVTQDASLLSQPAAQKACTERLRDYLKRNLPEYMIPAAFVYMSKLPLSSNGKLDRRALPCPEFDLPGAEEQFVAPRNHYEQLLSDIWAGVLGLRAAQGSPAIGIHQNFFELGGDSILAIQVIARANQAGLKLSPRHIFEASTIASLAELVGREAPILAEQGPVIGNLPLTPIQRWFFEQDFPNPAYWNQSFMLDLQQPLQREHVEQTLQQLLIHHDALRARFVRAPDGWKAYIAGPDEILSDHLSWRSLEQMDEAQRSREITAEAERLQSSLNLERGPLIKLAYFDLGEQPTSRRRAVLLLVAHHLVMDGVSWRIFLEDFISVYINLSSQLPAGLPLKTTSYRQWANTLERYAKSSSIQAQIPHWLELAQSAHSAVPLDFPGGQNHEASAVTMSTTLEEAETTQLLRLASTQNSPRLDHILLAAAVQALAAWLAPAATDSTPSIMIEMEGHGRESLQFEPDKDQSLNLTRTVGWFTSLYPVRLDLYPVRKIRNHPGEAFEAVQRAMQAVPQKGWGYGLIRYLYMDRLPADQSPQLELQSMRPQISFNYLGQIDANSLVAQTALPGAQELQAGIALSLEPRGAERAPGNPRTHILEINCVVAGERIQIEWTYSSELHRHGTISRLAQSCLQHLRQLIAWCQDPPSGQAPGDAPAGDRGRSSAKQQPSRVRPKDEIFGWSETDMENIFDEIEKMFESGEEDGLPGE